MGCELNPRIPYTEFSVIIKKQKEVISDCICGSNFYFKAFMYILISPTISKVKVLLHNLDKGI